MIKTGAFKELKLGDLTKPQQVELESRVSTRDEPCRALIRNIARFAHTNGFTEEATAIYLMNIERMKRLGLEWLVDEIRAIKESSKS